MRALLALVVGVLVASSTIARADEMDDWCAQVKKASSIVICSDPQLRQQAISRNRLFEVAREKLSPDEYKTLTADQSRWIKAYTARCGISIDDTPPQLPIPQTVIDCYRRESHARTAYLAQHLSDPDPTASMPPLKPPPSLSEANSAPSLPKCDSPAGLSIIRDGGACELQPPPAASPAAPQHQTENTALDQWMACLGNAADEFAGQPEAVRTVVEAALGKCGKYENAFLAEGRSKGALTYGWIRENQERCRCSEAASAGHGHPQNTAGNGAGVVVKGGVRSGPR